MSKKLPNTIAIITAECSVNEEFAATQGICDAAGKIGWRVLIFDAQNNFYDGKNLELNTNIYQLLDFDTVAGVLITQNVMNVTGIGTDFAQKCKAHGVPVVSVGYKTDVCPCYVFSSADVLEQIVDHVIEKHNCKTLNLVAGIQGNVFSEQRIDAFKKSLAKHDLEFDERRLFYGGFWEGPTLDGMNRFFDSGLPLPDAFICCNDVMAMTVCQELTKRGFSVPDDVIVTGYDGVEFEQYHTPRLTTAKCDPYILGKKSFELLFSLIEVDAVYATPPIHTIEPTVIFSQSCGCKESYAAGQNNFAMQVMSLFGNYRHRTSMLLKFDTLTSEVKNMEEVKQILPGNDFYGRDCWIMLNHNFPRIEADVSYTKEKPFSDTMDCFWNVISDTVFDHEPISRSEYIPDLERIFELGLTNIVFFDLYFGGDSIGYMASPFIDRNPSITLSSMERFVQSFSQCCSRVKNRGRLEYMNSHDQLTGIFNRRGFYSEIGQKIKKIEKESGNVKSASIVIHSIDMNELKFINDTFGHSEGDFAIKTLSNAIVAAGGESMVTARFKEESIAGSDGNNENDGKKADSENIVAARFGGDEFVAAEITHGNTGELILDFRNKFHAYLDSVNKNSGKPFKVSASCGSYTAPLPLKMRIDQIIAQADALMYKEKVASKKAR